MKAKRLKGTRPKTFGRTIDRRGVAEAANSTVLNREPPQTRVSSSPNQSLHGGKNVFLLLRRVVLPIVILMAFVFQSGVANIFDGSGEFSTLHFPAGGLSNAEVLRLAELSLVQFYSQIKIKYDAKNGEPCLRSGVARISSNSIFNFIFKFWRGKDVENDEDLDACIDMQTLVGRLSEEASRDAIDADEVGFSPSENVSGALTRFINKGLRVPFLWGLGEDAFSHAQVSTPLGEGAPIRWPAAAGNLLGYVQYLSSQHNVTSTPLRILMESIKQNTSSFPPGATECHDTIWNTMLQERSDPSTSDVPVTPQSGHFHRFPLHVPPSPLFELAIKSVIIELYAETLRIPSIVNRSAHSETGGRAIAGMRHSPLRLPNTHSGFYRVPPAVQDRDIAFQRTPFEPRLRPWHSQPATAPSIILEAPMGAIALFSHAPMSLRATRAMLRDPFSALTPPSVASLENERENDHHHIQHDHHGTSSSLPHIVHPKHRKALRLGVLMVGGVKDASLKALRSIRENVLDVHNSIAVAMAYASPSVPTPKTSATTIFGSLGEMSRALGPALAAVYLAESEAVSTFSKRFKRGMSDPPSYVRGPGSGKKTVITKRSDNRLPLMLGTEMTHHLLRVVLADEVERYLYESVTKAPSKRRNRYYHLQRLFRLSLSRFPWTVPQMVSGADALASQRYFRVANPIWDYGRNENASLLPALPVHPRAVLFSKQPLTNGDGAGGASSKGLLGFLSSYRPFYGARVDTVILLRTDLYIPFPISFRLQVADFPVLAVVGQNTTADEEVTTSEQSETIKAMLKHFSDEYVDTAAPIAVAVMRIHCSCHPQSANTHGNLSSIRDDAVRNSFGSHEGDAIPASPSHSDDCSFQPFIFSNSVKSASKPANGQVVHEIRLTPHQVARPPHHPLFSYYPHPVSDLSLVGVDGPFLDASLQVFENLFVADYYRRVGRAIVAQQKKKEAAKSLEENTQHKSQSLIPTHVFTEIADQPSSIIVDRGGSEWLLDESFALTGRYWAGAFDGAAVSATKLSSGKGRSLPIYFAANANDEAVASGVSAAARAHVDEKAIVLFARRSEVTTDDTFVISPKAPTFSDKSPQVTVYLPHLPQNYDAKQPTPPAPKNALPLGSANTTYASHFLYPPPGVKLPAALGHKLLVAATTATVVAVSIPASTLPPPQRHKSSKKESNEKILFDDLKKNTARQHHNRSSFAPLLLDTDAHRFISAPFEHWLYSSHPKVRYMMKDSKDWPSPVDIEQCLARKEEGLDDDAEGDGAERGRSAASEAADFSPHSTNNESHAAVYKQDVDARDDAEEADSDLTECEKRFAVPQEDQEELLPRNPRLFPAAARTSWSTGGGNDGGFTAPSFGWCFLIRKDDRATFARRVHLESWRRANRSLMPWNTLATEHADTFAVGNGGEAGEGLGKQIFQLFRRLRSQPEQHQQQQQVVFEQDNVTVGIPPVRKDFPQKALFFPRKLSDYNGALFDTKDVESGLFWNPAMDTESRFFTCQPAQMLKRDLWVQSCRPKRRKSSRRK